MFERFSTEKRLNCSHFYFFIFFIYKPNGTSESIATAATAPAEAPDTFIRTYLKNDRKFKIKDPSLETNGHSHVVESC